MRVSRDEVVAPYESTQGGKLWHHVESIQGGRLWHPVRVLGREVVAPYEST